MRFVRLSKHTARIAAVQVMYQKDMTNADIQHISKNFLEFYVKNSDEYKDINEKFFKRLVEHFSEDINIEEILNTGLQVGKSLHNLTPINKSILTTAVYEMIFEETDMPVIINEYVGIAKLFSDMRSSKFINAVLDKVSKQVERRCPPKA